MSSASQRNAERRVDLIRHIGGPLSPAEADDIRKQCAWEEVDAWLDAAESLRTKPVWRFVLGWAVQRALRHSLTVAFAVERGYSHTKDDAS